MDKGLISQASIKINAPIPKVWAALVTPATIKQYMFGTDVVSDWQIGSSIVWKGEWQGKPYEDRGKILKFEEGRFLAYSHFSPMEGKPDVPENYHTVTIELLEDGASTTVTISQDNNATEEARDHSAKLWQVMLDGLKKLLEK